MDASGVRGIGDKQLPNMTGTASKQNITKGTQTCCVKYASQSIQFVAETAITHT